MTLYCFLERSNGNSDIYKSNDSDQLVFSATEGSPKLAVTENEVSSLSRSGQDLQLNIDQGEQLTITDFFSGSHDLSLLFSKINSTALSEQLPSDGSSLSGSNLNFVQSDLSELSELGEQVTQEIDQKLSNLSGGEIFSYEFRLNSKLSEDESIDISINNDPIGTGDSSWLKISFLGEQHIGISGIVPENMSQNQFDIAIEVVVDGGLRRQVEGSETRSVAKQDPISPGNTTSTVNSQSMQQYQNQQVIGNLSSGNLELTILVLPAVAGYSLKHFELELGAKLINLDLISELISNKSGEHEITPKESDLTTQVTTENFGVVAGDVVDVAEIVLEEEEEVLEKSINRRQSALDEGIFEEDNLSIETLGDLEELLHIPEYEDNYNYEVEESVDTIPVQDIGDELIFDPNQGSADIDTITGNDDGDDTIDGFHGNDIFRTFAF